MRFFKALGALSAAGLLPAASWGLTRYAFGSPRGDQNDDLAVPRLPQFDLYREEIRTMIRSLNEIPCERVYITSYDGLRLAGRFYPGRPGAPLMIGFHGYRGTPSRDFSGGAALHIAAGRHVLLAEQRAQCGSEGRYITMGVRERRDCLDWIGFALERLGPDTKIILNGISMGASTVLMAAGMGLPDNVRGILADCPFPSPAAIVKSVLGSMGVPLFPAWPLLAMGARTWAGFGMEEADAAEAVRDVKIPILLIHGEDDRFVPCDMSRAIAAANPNIRLETFPGAGHGLSFLADRERYTRLAEEFIAAAIQAGFILTLLSPHANIV